MGKPMVSVCMITYNHENFIQEAINGVLNQEVDFDFELVISDDHSTDGTSEKILEVIHSHRNGELVKYHYQKKNMGIISNFVWTLRQCTGEFIAICEGDDYWTDNSKLKRQHELVSNSRELAGCFHYGKIKYEGKPYLEGVFKQDVPDLLFTEDLIASSSLVHTATLFFRREALVLPDWYENTLSGDFALTSILSSYGPLRKIPQVMSVYRVHDGGITNSDYYTSNILSIKIDVLKKLNEFHQLKFDHKFQEIIKKLSQVKSEDSPSFFKRVRRKLKFGLVIKRIRYELIQLYSRKIFFYNL